LNRFSKGWIKTNDGRKYYFHRETKKTQWNEPEEYEEKVQKLSEGWIEKTISVGIKTQWINVGNAIKGCLF
jgi:hypothetical protein